MSDGSEDNITDAAECARIVAAADASVRRSARIAAATVTAVNAALVLVRTAVLVRQTPRVLHDDDDVYCPGHPHAPRTHWLFSAAPLVLELAALLLSATAGLSALHRLLLPAPPTSALPALVHRASARAHTALAAGAVLAVAALALGGSVRAVLWLGGAAALAAGALPLLLASTVQEALTVLGDTALPDADAKPKDV